MKLINSDQSLSSQSNDTSMSRGGENRSSQQEAMTNPSRTAASGALIRYGRAGGIPNTRKSQAQQEREEIKEYLSKLRQIVPTCPKDGKISRLDLIQHVIDYIVQLQDTLVHHPVNKLLSEVVQPDALLNHLQQDMSTSNNIPEVDSDSMHNNSLRIPTLLQLQSLTQSSNTTLPLPGLHERFLSTDEIFQNQQQIHQQHNQQSFGSEEIQQNVYFDEQQSSKL